jgi:hypothetical protein
MRAILLCKIQDATVTAIQNQGSSYEGWVRGKQSPYNPIIQNYTKILYMIDEKYILTIQSEMMLRGPKSIIKVDKRRLISVTYNK